MSAFLSDDYLAEATIALRTHPGFSKAADGVDLRLQFVVTDFGEGSLSYYLSIDNGQPLLARGELDEPDATISNDYETAVAISNGDLNTQMAFIQGKIKVAGNMASLLTNQGVINEFPIAVKNVDVEY